MRPRLLLLGAVVLSACGGGSDGGRSPSAPSVQTPAPTPAPPTPTPVPTANVTGDWRSEARAWYFRLEQRGTSISGQVLGFRNIQYDPSDPAVQVSGTINTATRQVSFRAPVWAIDFGGTLQADGRRMEGTIYDCGSGTCRNYGEILLKQ